MASQPGAAICRRLLDDLNQEEDFDAGGPGLGSHPMAVKAVADQPVASQHDPLAQIFGAMLGDPLFGAAVLVQFLTQFRFTRQRVSGGGAGDRDQTASTARPTIAAVGSLRKEDATGADAQRRKQQFVRRHPLVRAAHAFWFIGDQGVFAGGDARAEAFVEIEF